MSEMCTDFKNALYMAKMQCNIFSALGLGPHTNYKILKLDLKQYLQLSIFLTYYLFITV